MLEGAGKVFVGVKKEILRGDIVKKGADLPGRRVVDSGLPKSQVAFAVLPLLEKQLGCFLPKRSLGDANGQFAGLSRLKLLI